MRNIILKTLKKSSYLAMFVAVLSANTTCTWIVHQPSMEQAKYDLRNFSRKLKIYVEYPYKSILI